MKKVNINAIIITGDNMKKISISIFGIIGIIVATTVLVIVALIAIVKLGDKFDDVKYKNNDMFSEISYKIPDEFEEDHYYNSKSYRYDDNGVYCYVDITVEEKGKIKIVDWLKENIFLSLDSNVSDVNELKVNNKKAYNINVVKDNSNNKSYYAFESSNYYYLLTYDLSDYSGGDREDLDTNKCYKYKDEIVNSISLK